ncbi:hypothetical protein OEG86_23810 [Hoeflea alexandrii]|nr:hypothetical protein [Hoeflea alexandrii]MCY0154742.1 hypothetical protein [Hoeflea alexandrii]
MTEVKSGTDFEVYTAPTEKGIWMMSDPIAWTVNVPLLTTPIIVRQLAAVTMIPLAILALLLIGLAWLEGNLHQLGAILRAILGVSAILLVLVLAAVVLFFNNRMTVSFEIDADGVRSRVVDRRAKFGRTLAIVLGALARNPTVAGAGLLARSNSSRFTGWDEIRSLETDQKRHSVLLRSNRLVLDAVFCTEDNFTDVKSTIEKAIHRSRKATRNNSESGNT